jgi:DNA invertase Pin-like site-specific DNA recombinase
MGQPGKPHNGKFVSYLRLSTLRQGRRGGELDAQREAIKRFLSGGQWHIIGEFVETESGRSMVRRPQLTAALAQCKKEKATLVVARLDRLYRNWAVMGALVESGVNVVCVDNPHATKQVIQTMAAFTQMERDLISERTKAALKQAKRRGVKLGNPDPAAAAARGRRTLTRQADDYAASVMPHVRDIVRSGNDSLQKIANALMRRGIQTRRGHDVWRPAQVANLLKRKAH